MTDQPHPFPSRPPRLASIFVSSPLYFVTLCVLDRRPILAGVEVQTALDRFAAKNVGNGVAIGRYVVMPDHLHLFLRLAPDLRLGETVRLLKRAVSSVLSAKGIPAPHWQEGFFDHVLRNDESYADKWAYVRENPVRAGLVKDSADWPFQGEPVLIDRA
jgi:REP element-mobilizing transposase RayT